MAADAQAANRTAQKPTTSYYLPEMLQTRQIKEAILKKFGQIPDNFAEKLKAELLSGQYQECKSMSGLVKQFADRCVAFSASDGVIHVVQGLVPDKIEDTFELGPDEMVLALRKFSSRSFPCKPAARVISI